MRRYAKHNHNTTNSNFNHISHKGGGGKQRKTTVDECPVHARQNLRRSAVGLNQIDLGGVIIDRPVDPEEAMLTQAYLDAQ